MDVPSRELHEYAALRATIRERGTARICMFIVGVATWAVLVVATVATGSSPVMTLVPLTVLAACFEAVFALHTGVERIGRYIQVFYEDRESPRNWEHTAMAFGRRFPARGPDVLFAWVFALTMLVNLVPTLMSEPLPSEWLVILSAHALFTARLAGARQYAARQRALDLERFQQLKQAP